MGDELRPRTGDGVGRRRLGALSAGFARFVIRARWAVIAGWIVLTVIAAMTLPDIKSSQTGSLGDLVANDASAITTEERSVDLFEFPLLSRTVIVQHQRGDFPPRAESRIYERALAITEGRLPGLESIPFALPITNDVRSPIATGSSAMRASTALTYLFFPLDIGPAGRTGLAQRLIDRYIDRPSDGTVGITGAVPARAEQVKAITDALPLVELATILLVTLAVGIHYRAIGAPLANVATIALTYIASIHLVGGIGQAIGIAVPQEVEPVLVALLFGIVTDYSIFFISRFRGLLAEGLEPHRAAERTTADLLPTIVAAAISVAGASAVLGFAQLGFFRAFGPGVALSVLVALAIVTTFVPAILAVGGRRLLWPGARRSRGASSRRLVNRVAGARRRLLGLPTSRPVLVVALTAVPLLALAAFVPRLELANTLISGLPNDSPARQALSQARKGFEPGAISPLVVLVERSGINADRGALQGLQRSLAERKHVAAVIGPAQVGGPSPDLGAVFSPTGDAVRYLLVLDVNPLGSRAIKVTTAIRRDLPGMLARAGIPDAEANLAGDTALAEETVTKTEDDLARVLPLSSIAVFIVLALFLAALVAPLYLVASSLLALGASIGLTVLVFQNLLGYGEITFYVPFAGIVLLIALGSDYNVYFVGRVWAEARTRPLREAVAVAGAGASTAITVAGLVLALSFSLLAIVPLRPFRELAFLLATGLLIDAFIVRSLLAPALITIFGERSGWPGKSLTRPSGIDAPADERPTLPSLQGMSGPQTGPRDDLAGSP